MQILAIILIIYTLFYLVGLQYSVQYKSVEKALDHLAESVGHILSKDVIFFCVLLTTFISFPIVGFIEVRRKFKGE